MNAKNGIDGLALSRHAHKSQLPGFTTRTVLHHVRCLHAAKGFKNLAKITHPHRYPFYAPFICIERLSSKGGANQEK